MSADHIALTAGLSAFALLFGTVYGRPHLRRGLASEGRARLDAITDALDKAHFLPALWVVACCGIGGWLITRIALSYT